ncbi:MAG TPA: 6-bladed beta-propeller [Gemmatimonadales bacterium]|nr:6-bladed beta-propeller [Gemmatimonadales bacterium]
MRHLILPCILLAACGGDGASSGSSASVVRDSAGIAIVEHGSEALASAPQWTLGTTPIATLGGAENDTTLDLSATSLAAFLPDNRLAVGILQPAELLVFSAEGVRERMLGRGGAGPGEYRMLQQLLAVGGDTLIAYDFVKRALLTYRADGTLVGEAEVPSSGGPVAPPLRGRLANGNFVHSMENFVGVADSSSDSFRPSVPFVTRTSDATSYDTAFALPGAEQYASTLEMQGMSMAVPRAIVFGAQSTVALTGASLWSSRGDIAEVVQHADSNGRPTAAPARIVRLPLAPRPVTDADKASYIAIMTEQFERFGGMMPPALKESELKKLQESRFAPSFAPIGQLLAGPNGEVWVGEGGVPGEATNWYVLDQQGTLLGKIAMPKGVLVAIGTDRVALRVEDEETGIVRLEVLSVSRKS